MTDDDVPEPEPLTWSDAEFFRAVALAEWEAAQEDVGADVAPDYER